MSPSASPSRPIATSRFLPKCRCAIRPLRSNSVRSLRNSRSARLHNNSNSDRRFRSNSVRLLRNSRNVRRRHKCSSAKRLNNSRVNRCHNNSNSARLSSSNNSSNRRNSNVRANNNSNVRRNNSSSARHYPNSKSARPRHNSNTRRLSKSRMSIRSSSVSQVSAAIAADSRQWVRSYCAVKTRTASTLRTHRDPSPPASRPEMQHPHRKSKSGPGTMPGPLFVPIYSSLYGLLFLSLAAGLAAGFAAPPDLGFQKGSALMNESGT